MVFSTADFALPAPSLTMLMARIGSLVNRIKSRLSQPSVRDIVVNHSNNLKLLR